MMEWRRNVAPQMQLLGIFVGRKVESGGYYFENNGRYFNKQRPDEFEGTKMRTSLRFISRR
jgi:hypothetical protein